MGESKVAWSRVAMVLSLLVVAYSLKMGGAVTSINPPQSAAVLPAVLQQTQQPPSTVPSIVGGESAGGASPHHQPPQPASGVVVPRGEEETVPMPVNAADGPWVPLTRVLDALGDVVGCPTAAAAWSAAPLEEQHPSPIAEMLQQAAAGSGGGGNDDGGSSSSSSSVSASFLGTPAAKKSLAIIALWDPKDEPSSDVREAVKDRAKRWAAKFDRAYIVGGGVTTCIMACNGISFPNLIACAAHALIHDGAAYGSLVVLDATNSDFDESACRIAQQVRHDLTNAGAPKLSGGRVLLDVVDTNRDLSKDEVCLRNHFMRHVQGHLSAAALKARWAVQGESLEKVMKSSEGQSSPIARYGRAQRLRALVIPPSLFHRFFRASSVFLLTDTPTSVGLLPFIEMIVAAELVGSGGGVGGKDKGDAAVPRSAILDAESKTSVAVAAKQLYRGLPFVRRDVDVTSCSTAVSSWAEGASHENIRADKRKKGFEAVERMPVGPWHHPKPMLPAQAATAVERLSRLAHGIVGSSATSPEDVPEVAIEPMKYTKKGGGPVSPESKTVIEQTDENVNSVQPAAWSKVNFYPPVIVISMKHNEILKRPFIRSYFAALERHFRRVVIVSTKVAEGYNDRFFPFPRHCLDGLSTTGCMMYLLRTRLLRHSGGLMFYHIDAFIYPHDFLGGGRMRDMLISKKHQYFGGKPDEWVFWPDHIKSDQAGTFPENGYMPWNRGIRTLGTFYWEHRAGNSMFQKTQDSRHNNFADIFFVPSRAFDVALDVLEYHFPFYVPFEGFIGYWAAMIKAMTTTRHEDFLHQGCCCCGADGEIPDYPAGHKTTPADKKSIANKEKRIRQSFDCDAADVTVPSVELNANGGAAFETDRVAAFLSPIWHLVADPGPARSVFLAAGRKQRLDRLHAALHEGTCRVRFIVTLSAATFNANAPVSVIVVAPLANAVLVEIRRDGAAKGGEAVSAPITVVVHAPNVNHARVSVSKDLKPSPLTVLVRTGVTMPTRVRYGWPAADGGPPYTFPSLRSKADKTGNAKVTESDVTVDEGDDALVVQPMSSSVRSVDVVVDTGSHLRSSVFVEVGRDGDDGGPAATATPFGDVNLWKVSPQG